MYARPSLFRHAFLPMALTLILLAAACSSDASASEDVASLETGVASLSDAADAATVDDQDAAELSPDEAALEFSQCMRDEGLDFPDLTVNAEGNIELRQAFQTVDRDADGFREAVDSCSDVIEQAGFGGGRREALESTEVQDALLAFSECVRDAGYDVGDLTLNQGGQGQGGGPGADGAAAADGETDEEGAEAAEGGGPAEGQRQQGFGDRGARFAENLGLDYEDPEVQETIDTCMPLIDAGLTEAGIGQPQDN